MTFPQLKPKIEDIIAYAYTRSLPSLTITSVGVYQVPIQGAIPEARYTTAWGLSRLNDLLEGNLGDYSSIRDVEIRTPSGRITTYDLMKALEQGDLTQNPTIRPGETIVINRIKRKVEIQGEVYKPGSYQLLDGEGFAEILLFSEGYTPKANISRIRVRALH